MFKKKINKVLIFIMMFFCFSTMLPAGVGAQGLQNAFGETGKVADTALAAGYDTTKPDDKLNTMVSSMVKVVLSLLGIVFLILMVYGGFLWMTARGNESQVEKSRNLITAAVIGLAIVIGAYAITAFIISRISTGLIT